MELGTLVNMIEKPSWKAMLISTVRAEGMDPWSIDVALLTSEYSKKIKKMRLNDFRVPANAVLASAILVRFKADSWNLLPAELPSPEESLQDYEDIGLLEWPEVEPMQRLTTRRVTLEELIQAIEQVMEKTKKKADSKKVPLEVMEFTIGEKEEFKKGVDDIYQKVLSKADSENLALFSDIVQEKTRPEVVRVLLSLLHLACENKISVWQEKQFGEIFISLKEVSN